MISSENGLLLATVLLNVQGRDIGRVRRGRPRSRDAPDPAAGRLLHQLERPLGEPGARPRSACRSCCRSCCSSSSSCSTSRITPRSRRRTCCWPSLRVDWRPVSRLAAWLQLLRRRVGRVHRAVRHGRADRCGDGHLPGGGGRAKATRAWRCVDASRASRGGHRRRAAAAAAKSHDGRHRRRGPAADHVEHARRVRK